MSNGLTTHERELLPLVVDMLRMSRGRGGEMSSTMMIAAARKAGFHMTGIEVRRIVNHIRVNAVLPCLASNGNGYFIAATRRDMDDCITGIRGRIAAMEEVIEALSAQRDVRFGKENTLFNQ